MLEFHSVSKRYLIAHEAPRGKRPNALERLRRKLFPQYEEFWALRDVNFRIRQGESVGIIGHNGAGKSTIMKILAGITAPTRGEIHVHGRIAALLEVGSGFHPELTGRENIYLSGAILGMPRREIAAKLDRIIAFSEIEQFIDTPVKRYSSGMYVRLGFSIAAHLEPDVLLLDEVFAVGDAKFQRKCIERVKQVRDGGATTVFISHDLSAVQEMCQRVILMKMGRLEAEGEPADLIALYQKTAKDLGDQRVYEGAGEVVRLAALRFRNDAGEETGAFPTGGWLQAELDYEVLQPVDGVYFELSFYTPDQQLQTVFTTQEDGGMTLGKGRGTIEFCCEQLPLQPGSYLLDAAVHQRNNPHPLHQIWRCTVLQVTAGKVVQGAFYTPHRWRQTAGVGP